MPFFIRKQNSESKDKKRKKSSKVKNAKETNNAQSKKKNKKLKETVESDEEIVSESDDETSTNGEVRLENLLSNEKLEIEEKNDVYKQRLERAKQYIEQIAQQEKQRDDETDFVSERLRDDVLEQSGKLHRQIASNYNNAVLLHSCRGHQQSITCLCVSSDNQFVFTGSKDCSIIKWSLTSGKKVHLIRRLPKSTEKTDETTINGHFDHVLAIAISTDGKFLVSGDKARLIQVWNAETCQHLKTLRGHHGPITGLVFRRNSHQLFSCSLDRSVKIWNIDEMAYVETLFGHQESIQSIDALMRERCVTAGGRDNSFRLWKIVEESHLVFNGPKASVDCITLINEEHVASGSDDGSIALWSISKRRPLFNLFNAHKNNSNDSSLPNQFWITALASLRYTDLLASGSFNGEIRLWKSTAEFNHLIPLFKIDQNGFVNDLKFSPDGQYLVAAIGQEHRLGRWWTTKNTKNLVQIFKLTKTGDSR